MIHSFTTHIAKRTGILCAVFLQHFYFWHLKNKGNKKHLHEGKYWTYNSINGFRLMFDYLTDKQIRYTVEKLVKNKYLVKGNYNKVKYDRTSWYALTNKALRLFVEDTSSKGQIDMPKRANGVAKKGEPIPDIDTFDDNYKIEKVKKFQMRNSQYKKIPNEFKEPDFNKLIKDL